jgi:hypothetical protein
MPEISYHQYDADDDSDNWSDLGGAQGKPPDSPKLTEFTMK